MWICPDCKREFENTNQQHFCTNKPETIDEYIAQQPEEVQEILKEVRSTIKSILPDAQERMTWGMPTFWDKHNIIHFASFKKHLGIYPGPDAIIYFAEELKEYKTSKGAIQLPYSKPIPLPLIAKITKCCCETANHH